MVECPICPSKHDMATAEHDKITLRGCLGDLLKALAFVGLGVLSSIGAMVVLAYILLHLRIEWLP